MPQRGAAYLVGSGPCALIEAGTPIAADILLRVVDGLELEYVFVTHIHLDHAGGAGALTQAHPETTVVVHPRGARHLVDPARLIEGVRAASPDLFKLYGEPVPVEGERLHKVEDGESFSVGQTTIRALHAPGHAPHHVCYIDGDSGTLFTGDAAGNYGIPVDVPLTVPPRFDIDASIDTLRRLRSMKPRALAYTHFGIAGNDPEGLLRSYEQHIRNWFERLQGFDSEQEAARAILAEPKYEGLSPKDRHSIEMCVRGAFRTLESANRNDG